MSKLPSAMITRFKVLLFLLLLILYFILRFHSARPVSPLSMVHVARTTSSNDFQKFNIIAHSGFGRNVVTRHDGEQSIQCEYRENTIPAFMAGAAYHVDFVELDVQVTSDGVPVVFHDDFVVYKPAELKTSDAHTALQFRTVAGMTAAEFQALSQDSELGTQPQFTLYRPTEYTADGLPILDSCVKWVCEHDAELPTLDHVLSSLPPHLGVMVEVKVERKYAYPPKEAIEHTLQRRTALQASTLAHVANKSPNSPPFFTGRQPLSAPPKPNPTTGVTPPSEVSRLLNAILPVIQARQKVVPRPLVLASFDPEVALELHKREPDVAMVLITNGRSKNVLDKRRRGVKAAWQMVKSHRLQGVVADSRALMTRKHLVEVMKWQGKSLYTGGESNRDAQWVLEQRKMMVKGVIVDDVPLIMGAIVAEQLAV